jgi:hypothetical protein
VLWSVVGNLEAQENGECSSSPTPKASKIGAQSPSAGEDEYLSSSRERKKQSECVFLLSSLRSSAGWMISTHIGEGDLYSVY